MDTKQIVGLTVLAISEGRRLGAIDRVYLDAGAEHVVAFAVDRSGDPSFIRQAKNAITDAFAGHESSAPTDRCVIHASDVHAVGPDALTIDDASKMRDGQGLGSAGELLEIGDLTKRRVVTEGGTAIGQVSSVVLDPRSLAVTAFVVSSGRFESDTEVASHQVSTVGPKLIVVADEVAVSSDAAAMSGRPRVIRVEALERHGASSSP